ncbi:MAG: response regulator transcription factor [Chloroflexi bacterium]|nr:response regulator transcription factor [Chloroflexota bacterium]
MSDLNVLIIGDNPLARMGLAALLAGQPGLIVVGQTSGADDLQAEVDLYQPDVIVWEWGWNTPERSADARDTGVPVVALLTNAAQAADLRAAGVSGFLLGDTDAETLAAAIMAAAQGLVVAAPSLLDALLPTASAADAPVEALTPREREVLQLLAEGLPNKTIAARLNITDHTVKYHVNAIMGKLNAQSRTDAVVKATRLGLIIL